MVSTAQEVGAALGLAIIATAYGNTVPFLP